jgi:tetratricopeptide (TPR) repeat protein
METAEKESRLPDRGWTQHYDVVKEMGDCYVQVGNYVEAEQCFEKAANLDPDKAGPYVGIAVVAMQRDNLEDAEIAFRVARRLEPDCSKAICGLAMIAQQRNSWQQAFDLYLRCLDVDRDNLTALLGLFQASCEMGSFSKVIHYLEVYLQMHPGDSSVMFCLATLQLKDGKTDQSRELLVSILAADSGNVDAANLLEEVEHDLAQCR